MYFEKMYLKTSITLLIGGGVVRKDPENKQSEIIKVIPLENQEVWCNYDYNTILVVDIYKKDGEVIKTEIKRNTIMHYEEREYSSYYFKDDNGKIIREKKTLEELQDHFDALLDKEEVIVPVAPIKKSKKHKKRVKK